MTVRRWWLSVLVAVAVVWLAGATASAQIARVSGVVRDVNGEPLRGALVTVDAGGGIMTAATDENGRFSVIGMRSGVWKFEVEAPGYLSETGEMRVRALGAQNPPLTIALRRSGLANTGPLAGLPARDLQEQLSAADALFEEERWNEAISAYRAILAKAPSLTAINLQIASAHRHRKDYAAAIQSYEVILAADPRNERAQVGIAMTNLERGDPTAAEQSLRTAAADASQAGPRVSFSLAELLASQGRGEEAAQWYARAADADASWGKPRLKLGELALARGDEMEAARQMSAVISVDPMSPEAELAATALERLKAK